MIHSNTQLFFDFVSIFFVSTATCYSFLFSFLYPRNRHKASNIKLVAIKWINHNRVEVKFWNFFPYLFGFFLLFNHFFSWQSIFLHSFGMIQFFLVETFNAILELLVLSLQTDCFFIWQWVLFLDIDIFHSGLVKFLHFL